MKSFDEVWKLIVKHEGQSFKTKRGIPFKYTFSSPQSLVIDSSTTDYYYTSKRSFEIGVEIGKCAGPVTYKGEKISGSSYVWAILHDKRINSFE